MDWVIWLCHLKVAHKVLFATRADDKFCNIFPNIQKSMIFRENRLPADDSHEIALHALFVNFEKAAKFEIVVCALLVNSLPSRQFLV